MLYGNLILLLLPFTGFSQQNFEMLYSKKNKDTAHILELLEAGKKMENRNMDSAFLFYNKALSLSTATAYKQGMFGYYNHASSAHGKQNEFEKAFELLDKYLAAAQKENNRDEEARAYIQYGNVYSWSGDAANEVSCYQKAVEILSTTNDVKRLATVYGNISTTYGNQKLFDEALRYANLAVDIYKKNNDEEGMAAAFWGWQIFIQKKRKATPVFILTGKHCG